PQSPGNNNNLFTVDPTTGTLKTISTFTVTPGTTTLTVQARSTDPNTGLFIIKTFSLNVVNPPTSVATTQTQVPGTTSTSFAQFTSSDPGRTVVYSLVPGFGDNGSFSINPTTGALSTGTTFPPPGKTSFSVQVQVSDSVFAGLNIVKTFSFALVNAP